MSKLTKGFYLLLGSVLLFSCTQEKNKLEPKRTVIAGVVTNFSDNASALIVNYCNSLSDEHRFAQNLTESSGYFHTEHKYVFAQNLTIRFANKYINLFVHPGDSVFVEINADKAQNDFSNAVTFSGDNAKLNMELFLWTMYSYNLVNKSMPKFDDNTLPEDLLASVKQNFDIAQDSINAYSKRTNMSDFMKIWAFIDYKFVIANYLMDYDNPQANRWDIFTNPIFDVFNENNFQTMYFPYHLSVCRNAFMKSEVEINQLFSEDKYASAIQLTIEKLFEKVPKGVVRDMILFTFLQNKMKELPVLYTFIPKAIFSQDYFSRELEKLSEMNNSVEKTLKISEAEIKVNGVLYMTNSETEELPNMKLLNFLIEKYKDKVIYIDIWATWCGPCLVEFESATPTLHKYFKEKDVVFVNLCMSSNVDRWQPTIMRYNIGGENYFLEDNATQLFMGEYNISGFPTYFIIDKNGELNNSAPRPSNLESAIQKIEACLR